MYSIPYFITSFRGAKVRNIFVNRELFSRFLFAHLRKKPYLCIVIELSRHIEILLLSNDCVIVPDLGGFMAHHIDARYDEQEQMFLPPLRTLGFNPQLKMNDSLLVQSYIEAYDISYPEALRRIQSEVTELKQHLETEGMYELNDIGVLSINDEGHLQFAPCEAGILTPSLYGLGAFEMKPLRSKAIEVPVKTDLKDENTITIKMSWLRNMAAAAAAVVAFLMISSPISNSQMPATVQQSAFLSISNTQQQSVNTDDTLVNTPQQASTEEPAIEEAEEMPAAEPAITEPAPRYCIVMASQVSKRNAEDFIERLRKKGFSNAYILETKFRRVVYGSFASDEEANAELKSLRSQSSLFNESWVMEIK